ncbi:LMBR1 domain containing protein [Entamoeba marina]
MVIIPFILLVCNIYFVVYFQNPEEKHMNWGLRILIIFSLELLEISVLLLPADVLNTGPPYGEIPMEYFWYIIFYLMIILIAFVLPIALSWYNQIDDEKPWYQRLVFSFLYSGLFLLVIGVFTILLYLLCGVAEVPVNYQATTLSTDSFDWSTIFDEQVTVADDETSTLNFRLSPILFIISGFSTIGYILVLIFGGLGLGALPIWLIYEFVNRPKPVTETQYKQYTNIIGGRAMEMLDESNELKDMKSKGGRKYRKKYQKFREEVYFLDKALKALNSRHELRGFLWGFVALGLGVIASIISILWIFQMIIWTILQIWPFIDWLMSFLTGSLTFFGAIVYAIFACYLLLCVFKAVTYVGFRFAFGIAFYPLEVGNTFINGFLFNCIILSMTALGLTQFCSETFSNFSAGTTVQSFFGVAITNMRYIKYIYKYAPFVMPILCVAMIALMLVSKLLCGNKKEKDALEVLLQKQTN